MMIRPSILFVGIATLLALQVQTAEACKVIGRSKSGEPLCMTTSDGNGRPFVDERLRARRIQEMKQGGTKLDNGLIVSPYVPGSKQDKQWQAERRRLGIIR